LHIQLQKDSDDEHMFLSTPDSNVRTSPDIATDDDVDAALDDLQMTLTGQDIGDAPPALLNKCPELHAYHLVYK